MHEKANSLNCCRLSGRRTVRAPDDVGAGYWLIRVGDTSVQTSFWFGLVLLLGAFIVLHFALRLLSGIIRPVGRFRTWNSRARNRRAMKRTVRGLVALTEGRWKKPRKHWCEQLTIPAHLL